MFLLGTVGYVHVTSRRSRAVILAGAVVFCLPWLLVLVLVLVSGLLTPYFGKG